MQSLLQLDATLVTNLSTLVAANPFVTKLCSIIGVGLVYVLPFLFIYVWFIYSRKLSLRAAIAGLFAWEGLSKLVAALVDRPRPSASLVGVKELVFHRPDTSFPSDHSAFLMAVALTFYLQGQKNLGNFVLLIAVLVGVCRVAIGVHFPGDILGGWLVGALVAYLLYLIDEPLDKYVLEPLVKLARRFRL